MRPLSMGVCFPWRSSLNRYLSPGFMWSLQGLFSGWMHSVLYCETSVWENCVNQATVKSACNRLFFPTVSSLPSTSFVHQFDDVLSYPVWYVNCGRGNGITGISGWLRAVPVHPVCPCEQFWCPGWGASSGPSHGSPWGFNSGTRHLFLKCLSISQGPGPSTRSGIGRNDFWTSPLCFFKILGFNLWRR